MHVGLLGPLEVVGDDGEPLLLRASRQRALLTLLALRPGVPVPVDRLIDELWTEAVPQQPSNALQVIVFKLRRVIGADRILTQPPGYMLAINPDDVDAVRFERLAAEGRAALAIGDTDTAITRFDAALALWRGDPLLDLPDDGTSTAIANRWSELHAATIEDRVEALLTCGRHRELVGQLEAAVVAAPFRERLRAQLMLALYRSGRQAEALRAFADARRTLADELGLAPGVDLRRLETAILNQDPSLDPPPSAAAPAARVAPAAAHDPGDAPIGQGFRRRGNVRHPVGQCIGRVTELESLVGLVARHRLVTLTGPGGVGKTRLSLELCARVDEVPDGVWWVELASARTLGDVTAALQRSLGVQPVGGSEADAELAAVIAVLVDRSAVLVIDNCEQVVAAVAQTVHELLGRCGLLRIVATSREGLGIPAERLFPVAPLQPAAAVELFEARIADPVDADEGTRDAIAQICEQLDRLPLALELAAARTRHLRLEEIRDRLSNRFELLSDGSRTMESHQRGLRAVADWSFELLDERERIVFERLSVFADGATIAAASAVCAAGPVGEADVERQLQRLVDKSLVVADRSGAQTRFRMLQTLADYAAERLDARGTRPETLHAHATWVSTLAHTMEFGAAITGAMVAAVQEEDVAIRDAVNWSLDADPRLALDISCSLSPYWFGTMRVPVGWELLNAALDAADGLDPPLRCAALVWASVFATMVRDDETAQRHTDEAWRFEQELGDPARLGAICFARVLAGGYRSPAADAIRWVAPAREHFAAAGQPVGLGHVSFAEGAVQLVAGDPESAALCLRRAIDAFREHPDHLGLILAVSRLGELAWRLPDIDLFAEMHAELLELGRASRSTGVIAGATARLALARLVHGQMEEAQQLARDALAASSESFMPVVNGYAFRTAGLVNLRLGHLLEGRAHLHAAIEAFEQGTGSMGLGQAALCWVDVSQSFARVGDAAPARQAADHALELAAAAGDPWVQQQALSWSAALTADVTSTLP